MHHKELFSNKLLKRIPMASITMAISLAMEHVPKEYVVGHLAFKALYAWVLTGGKEDKMLTLHPTLMGEVERARVLFVAWDAENSKMAMPAESNNRKMYEVGRGPLYAYMTLRALACGVNVVLSGDTSELVDLLECLDNIPAREPEGEDLSESITDVLQSLDEIFDQDHWKDIVAES